MRYRVAIAHARSANTRLRSYPPCGAGGTGDVNRMSHLPMARLIILGVLAVIIVGNVLGGIAASGSAG